MIIIKNIKLGINESYSNLENKIKKILKLDTDRLRFKIIKESIDARKEKIEFVYQVEVDINWSEAKTKKFNNKNVSFKEKSVKLIQMKKPKDNVMVVGSGPSGLFCAYLLAKEGFNPVVIERGKKVEDRKLDVDKFFEKGILNTESNVQFGEGGAGTFSDGKLTTRSKNKLVDLVLDIFVENGAPEEIKFMHKAHIGTDLLINVVKNMRENIISRGGKFLFEEKLEDFIIENNELKGIKTNKKAYKTENLVLAIGHSARDTMRMLDKKNIAIENKPFAVGFRIEHPQIMINKAQFKKNYKHPRLGQGEYALSQTVEDRGVYTFCMCPGGRVIAAASENEMLCVNGMSYHDRSLANANSAIIATVDTKDFGEELFSGIKYQEEIEKKAYILGGSNFFAPVQRVKDFIDNKKTEKIGSIKPSYTPGYTLSNLNDIYSEEITKAIKEAIVLLDRRLKGFSMDDAILTGVETRSSSPIKILRDRETMESTSVKGLYPAGEGAGFSGGIVSSALDGLNIAIKIIEK